MRNEHRLVRVLSFSKLTILWCILLSSAGRISGQIENKTFENAFGLDSAELSESRGPACVEGNDTTWKEKGMCLAEAVDEVEDLNEKEWKKEGKAEEVADSVDNVPKEGNGVEDGVTFSRGPIGKKSGKFAQYVRYGEYFDIDGRDH